ncbi:MAG: hypothetical protein WBD08_17495, partial [Candidatus Acidiferrales bacterium]
MKSSSPLDNAERTLLVGVGLKQPKSRAGSSGALERQSLEELDELARSAGARVVGTRLQMRDSLDAATLLGRGALSELQREVDRVDAGLV